ncbi:DNA polymerase III subunit delta' [Superficieibacter electus]|uniref:DNA polymerase III subunit delta' n=1 Tax=Superficieibacter electus TaxID=2022662 RepID=A0A2P5GJK7_9ENTR|nr:DNA polymerase III subunit delta' [Superficieibacter electus]POP41881.1 DNA polymerase III subunit delta' [Superficieibacter electus]POP44188.1 DNA polymerase III subunit delta' [Superficieibacter electus]
MKWYPWLRPHFEALVASYQAGRGHHALLIHALPGMGAESLLYAISRYLMCQQPQGHKSCGKCHSCLLMQAGTHPDYYSLAPEKGKSSLGIDAVRELSEKLYEHARLGGAKVVWLTDATLLTDAAANALLKTLEEPPANTWFLLACREPAHLMATLRSRCRLHHLAPPAEAWALAWLAREVTASHDMMLTALRLSGNAPAAALQLLQPDVWGARQQLCQGLELALTEHDWLSLLSTLNHDNVATRLHWLAALLLDALKVKQHITHLTNADAVPLVNQLTRELKSAQLQCIMQDICACREQLLNVSGLNRELTLTDRLLRWEHDLQTGVALPVSHL